MRWARAAVLLAAAPALAWGLGADMAPAGEGPGIEFESSIAQIPASASGQHAARVLVFGSGAPPQLPGVSVYSPHGFFSVATVPHGSIPALKARGHAVMADFMVELDGGYSLGPAAQAGQSSSTYTGKGSTVAIVDTGVDFSNPDLRGSLARDARGHPIMLDADGQGIVITNATFYAHIDGDGILRNHPGPLPENATASVYRNPDGVFLDIERGGEGTTIWVYNSFYPQAGEEPVFEAVLNNDMKIGESHRDYIKSLSGVYHLGVAYQGALSGSLASLQLVPLLVTDPNVEGVYDTVTADLSTSWGDYTDSDELDFDFTDERPAILGSGNEFLVYDSDGDGRDDYSAGAVGARVLDVYAAVQRNATARIHDAVSAVNGTLLPPIDPEGNFVGLMTDFDGHGTASAGTVASAAEMSYDIYGNGTQYSVRGSAPGASILPVKSIWFGDTVYAWLWTAGFDNEGEEWVFSGRPRADVVSNSWGIQHFPDLGAPPGLDVLSLAMAALSAPGSLDDDYPGVLMVSSAGNSGPGYGTLGAPNASPLGLTVGAATTNAYVGYGPFKDQPRFGNSTGHAGHLADFSSRGPGALGDPKPDIVGPGAYSFVPSGVLRADPEDEPFSLYGGTSMAAPAVAGAAAVVMEAMREEGVESDPFSVKNILLSTARDMGNDPYSQGAGLYDTDSALGYVSGSGPFAVYNDASYANVREALEGAIRKTNSTELQLERFSLPPRDFPMTSWFGGHVEPGGTSVAEFTISNRSGEPIEVGVSAVRPHVIQQSSAQGTTEPRVAEPGADEAEDGEEAYAPNYVPLSEVREFAELGSFYEPVSIPDGADMMVLNVSFGMEEFMPGADEYADRLSIASVYIYDWHDRDGDARVTSDELDMVSRGGSWGTVQELRLSDPASLFSGVPLVGIYPVPIDFSYWRGQTDQEAEPIDYTLTATFYADAPWEAVWTSSRTASVPAGGTASVDAAIKVPEGTPTGAYQGFLEFSSATYSARAPVSYAVAEPVSAGSRVLVSGSSQSSVVHGPGYIKGAFDMSARYMAGDWRQYYFDVRDPGVESAVLDLYWKDEHTSASVFVAAPDGRIASTSTPSGAFGHFIGWPSLDWLGTTGFSEGGGFYPVTTRNSTATAVHVPVNQTGVHSVLVHSTLFGGSSVTEPVALEARFYGPR